MDFRTSPIHRPVLAHTGRLDGDDTGYRDVAVSPFDDTNPDLLVPVGMFGIMSLAVYAHGRTHGLTPYYGAGLGASPEVLVREPVAHGLWEVDAMLRQYKRRLIVLDGFRPASIQAALWRAVRQRIIDERGWQGRTLSVADELELGTLADDVGSYNKIVMDDAYQAAIKAINRDPRLTEQISEAVEKSGGQSSFDQVLGTYVVFMANLGRIAIKLDKAAPTAHGSGGAIDVWMVNTETGQYVNLGCPFDYVPRTGVSTSPGVIDYFELIKPEEYRAEVENHAVLRQYLAELGITEVTEQVFREAQEERRILKHAFTACGGTYFSLNRNFGEPWHFQLGNERGGRQAKMYHGAGNTCHSLLENVRGCDGKFLAVWGNAAAHRMAEARWAQYAPQYLPEV